MNDKTFKSELSEGRINSEGILELEIPYLKEFPKAPTIKLDLKNNRNAEQLCWILHIYLTINRPPISKNINGILRYVKYVEELPLELYKKIVAAGVTVVRIDVNDSARNIGQLIYFFVEKVIHPFLLEIDPILSSDISILKMSKAKNLLIEFDKVIDDFAHLLALIIGQTSITRGNLPVV